MNEDIIPTLMRERGPLRRALHSDVARPTQEPNPYAADQAFWIGVARACTWAGFLGFMLLAALVVGPAK